MTTLQSTKLSILLYVQIALLLLPMTLAAQQKNVLPSKMTFNPALDGGTPSLKLIPNPEYEGEPKQLLVTQYMADSATEVQHEVHFPINTDEVWEIMLNGRDQPIDVVGVRVSDMDTSPPTAIREWRAYNFKETTLREYTGMEVTKPPAEFDAFWTNTLHELAAVPIDAEITPVPEKNSATGNVYQVKMNSFGNVPIIAWYCVPKNADRIASPTLTVSAPVIQFAPGYGAEQPPMDRTAEGWITLSLNPRSHGPSREFFKTDIPHHVWKIESAEEYYYRGAYMDCVRGIDFLLTRPEVDKERIAAEGGSQGGMFAIITAALHPAVKSVVSYIPLSSFDDYTMLNSNNIARSLHERMVDPVIGTGARRSLALIDPANLATRVKVPTLIAVALQDRICPPANGIIAYHRLPEGTEKQLVVDPDVDHAVTPMMREAAKEWHKKHLLDN